MKLVSIVGISGENALELDYINNKPIDPPLSICKVCTFTDAQTLE